MGKTSKPIQTEEIHSLLLDAASRGIDASGVCLQYEDGTHKTYKEPKPAWNFLAGNGWKQFARENLNGDVRTVILHARAWTVGYPTDNRNNHPLTVGKSSVVHNGGISNYEELFNRMKLKPSGQVDSDIIRAILDEHGLTKLAVEKLDQMRGFAAIAAVHVDYPGKVLLCRSGSPLVIGIFEDDEKMVWASRKQGIHDASRIWVEKWGLPFKRNRSDCKFSPVEREVAMLVGQKGVEWEVPFTSAGGRIHSVVYRNHETYPDKQKQLTAAVSKEKAEEAVAQGKMVEVVGDKPELMECPKRCGKMVKFTAEQQDLPLWMLGCPGCGIALGEVEG